MNYALVFLTLSTLSQIKPTEDPPKKPFSSQPGGFSIAIPGTISESLRTDDSLVGPLVNRIYQSLQDDKVYTVICVDYPNDLKPAESEELLDGILKGYTEKSGGTLLSLKKLNFDGESARQASLKLQGGIMHSTFFLKEKRIYQILMFYKKPQENDDAEFQRFADSFKSFKPVGNLKDGLVDPSAWKEYLSADGGFRVKMIGAPQESIQTIDTPGGQIEIKMVIGTSPTGENFGVSYSPVAKTDPPQTPKVLYENAVNGTVENLKGTLVYRKAIEFDGKPGTEAQISLPGDQAFPNGIYLARIYWVGDRLYQIIYVGPSSNAKKKEVVDFLDSFKLETEKPTKAAKPD